MVANLNSPNLDFFALGAPQVFADSCLCMMSLATGAALGNIVGDCQIING